MNKVKNDKENLKYEKQYTFKKPRGYSLVDMVYKDRCMLKWQGFLLSDHNEAMEEEKVSMNLVTERIVKSQMEYDKWNILLMESLKNKTPLNFEYVDESCNIKYFKGVLYRYTKDCLYIRDKEKVITVNKKMFIDIQP